MTRNQSVMNDICEKYSWNRQKIMDNALKEIKTRKLGISKDTFRKRMDRAIEQRGMKYQKDEYASECDTDLKGNNINNDSDCTDDEEYDEDSVYVDGLKNETAYLRHELTTSRSIIKRLRLSLYSANNVIDNLRDDIHSIECDKFTIPQIKQIKGKRRLVMPITDVHYGETINAKEVNGANAYNTSIAKKRHMAFFADAINVAKENGCSVLDIPMLGDIFSGNIHDELRETNEAEITLLIIDYFKFISGAILSMKKLFSEINIYCVVGNHSRIDQKWKSKKKSYSNYEYILYSFLKDKFDSVNGINVTLSDSTILVASLGSMKWRFEHGDEHQGGSGFASPWGSLAKNGLLNYNKKNGEKFDAVIMGHWHTAGWMPMKATTVPIIIAPSIVGPGEYSMQKLHDGYDAAGMLVVVDGNDIYSQRIVKLNHIM